jgi:hypothetical protein
MKRTKYMSEFKSKKLYGYLLFTIIIYNFTILPSLISLSNYLYLVLLLLLISGTCLKTQNRNPKIFEFYILLLFLIGFMGGLLYHYLMGHESFLRQSFYAIIFLLFTVLLLFIEDSLLKTTLNIFVNAVLVMAVCGITAYALFIFNVLEKEKYLFTLAELGGIAQYVDHNYFIPFGLSLILTEIDPKSLYLLGVPIYRVCGWMTEPHFTVAAVTPAIFLLIFSRDLSSINYRKIKIIILWIFWLLAGSTVSILSVFIIFCFYYIKKLKLIHAFFGLLFCVSLITFLKFWGDYLISYFSYNPYNNGFVESRISGDSHTLNSTATILLGNNFSEADVFSYFRYLILFSGIVATGWAVKKKKPRAFVFISTYFIISGVKYGWAQAELFMITLFFFACLLRFDSENTQFATITT